MRRISKIIQLIEKAFPRLAPPFPAWQACITVEDFSKTFGKDFFTSFWPHMHDDLEVTQFLLPFIMEFYLLENIKDESGLELDLFIGTLDPITQREVQKNFSLDNLFTSLTQEQRRVVCEWLRTLKRKDAPLVNVESAIAYWCVCETPRYDSQLQ